MRAFDWAARSCRSHCCRAFGAGAMRPTRRCNRRHCASPAPRWPPPRAARAGGGGHARPAPEARPCDEIQPTAVPPNARLWGHEAASGCAARKARRSLERLPAPVTVKVFAPAVVAARALPAGAVLEQNRSGSSRVDLAKTLRRHCARRRPRWAARWAAACRPAAACASRTSSHASGSPPARRCSWWRRGQASRSAAPARR